MSDKVKVSWGKEPIYPDEKCNFQGGNRPGCTVPRPAIESLKFEEDSLALYKGIIIMFDKDCDVDDEVEEKIMKIIKENNWNLLDEKEILVEFFEKNLKFDNSS